MTRRHLWVPLLLAVPALFAAAPSASAQAAPTISVAPTVPTVGVQAQVTVTCDAAPEGDQFLAFIASILPAGTVTPNSFTGSTLSLTQGVTFDAAGAYTVEVTCRYIGATTTFTLDVTVQAPTEPTTSTTGTTIAAPTTSSASGAGSVPATNVTLTAAAASDLPPTGSSGTEWAVVAALTVVALGALVVVGAGAGRRRERGESSSR